MKDTRWKSISETLLNVGVGFMISFASNYVILPAYGLPFNLVSFLEIGFWYTIISIARQYLFRRMFNLFGPSETLLTLLTRLIKWARN